MQNRVSPELRRNNDDKFVFGVASGLADYFGVDVAIVRVLFIITAIMSAGTTLLVYLLLAILVPEQEPPTRSATDQTSSSASNESESVPQPQSSHHRYRTSSDKNLIEHRRNVAGWTIIVLGVILLATNVGFFRWLSFGRFWPLLIIALGVAMIFGLFREKQRRD